MTDIPPQPEPKTRRWGRMLVVAGLVGIGMYSCVQWSGEGFRKMLSFTTADTEALRRLRPDTTKPTFRFTLKTDKVFSDFCDGNNPPCTYDRLIGERDTIQLPRSITYELPTLLVNGVAKDGSSVYLSLWHRSLDPAFDGETPPETLMVLDEKGQPTQERWKDRQARNVRNETLVEVTLSNSYWSASGAGRVFGPPPTAPTCDVENRSSGILVYRHKQGYEASLRNDADIKDKACKIGSIELDYQNGSYALILTDGQNLTDTVIFCNQTSANCNVSHFFENWTYKYSIRKSGEGKIIEIQKRVTALLKSSVVARSYPIHAGGVR